MDVRKGIFSGSDLVKGQGAINQFLRQWQTIRNQGDARYNLWLPIRLKGPGHREIRVVCLDEIKPNEFLLETDSFGQYRQTRHYLTLVLKNGSWTFGEVMEGTNRNLLTPRQRCEEMRRHFV